MSLQDFPKVRFLSPPTYDENLRNIVQGTTKRIYMVVGAFVFLLRYYRYRQGWVIAGSARRAG